MLGEIKGENIVNGAGGPLATSSVLARWLGISGKAVYDLAKAGILVRVSRNQFSLEESVRRYCEHVRESHRSTAGDAVGDQAASGARDSSRP